MKKMKQITVLAITIATLLFTSCAKDGDTGPKGDKGDNGTNGAPGLNGTNGSDGQDGTDGQDGNANVIAYTFIANPGDWITAGTPGLPGHSKFVEIYNSDINQDIVDNGSVIAYFKDYTNYWSALPFTFYGSNSIESLFHPMYRLNYFEVDYYRSDLLTPTITTSFEFKIVIIDGTAKMANPDLNWNDFDEVSKKFNLK